MCYNRLDSILLLGFFYYLVSVCVRVSVTALSPVPWGSASQVQECWRSMKSQPSRATPLQNNACHKGSLSTPPQSRFPRDLCCSIVLTVYSYRWKVRCITWPIMSGLFECVRLHQLISAVPQSRFLWITFPLNCAWFEWIAFYGSCHRSHHLPLENLLNFNKIFLTNM